MLLGLPMLLPLLAGLAGASDCPPLDRLSDGATTGSLSDHAVTCLEAAVGDGALANRLVASKLLIGNAWSAGKQTDWARHVKHHLESLDPDDADLAVRYGRHLLDHGAPAEAQKWAEHALEHRYAWDEQSDKADRLYEALSLRAGATQAALDGLPEHTPTLDKRALEGRVRLYAIEWLAHALKNELGPTKALEACVATGWEAERCRERAEGLE